MCFIPPPAPPAPPSPRNIVHCRGCNSLVDASVWGDLCSICVVTGGKSPPAVEETVSPGWHPTSIQIKGWEPTLRPQRPLRTSREVVCESPKAPMSFQEEMDAALAFNPLQDLILQRTKNVI
jgi:hypothetical protein